MLPHLFLQVPGSLIKFHTCHPPRRRNYQTKAIKPFEFQDRKECKNHGKIGNNGKAVEKQWKKDT
jgi:hypothetical protein